ncbi:hypothetical protein [Streptomyces sp. HM190]|uniref:hypothetical protein n=1 Tax=Streptomyces sp. HM190 TaxID=2695266 RepID=UPI001F1703D6|nr:hypothetical protein [Streptomyces sp. HM190]
MISLGLGDARSLAEVALTVIGYATAPLITARHLKQAPTLALTAPALLLSALVHAPAAALARPTTMPCPHPRSSPPWRAWA